MVRRRQDTPQNPQKASSDQQPEASLATTDTAASTSDLTVAPAQELALSPVSTVAGITATANLSYEVIDGHFFLTSTSRDTNGERFQPTDKVSMADLAKMLDIRMSDESRTQAEGKILTHLQWLTVFRSDVDNLPDELKPSANIRPIGSVEYLTIAINDLNSITTPVETTEDGSNPITAVVDFLQDNRKKALEGVTSQPRFQPV